MPADIQGFLNSYDSSAQIINDIHVFSTAWYSNRCPLVTRLPRQPALADKFDIVNRFYRARTATLSGAFTASTGSTTITVTDSSPFLAGDVLEVLDTAGSATERVEVQAVA